MYSGTKCCSISAFTCSHDKKSILPHVVQVDCLQTFSLQRKFATEYQVVTAAPLDRERRDLYTLVLRCEDGLTGPAPSTSRGHEHAHIATPRHVTETTLRVTVTDVNDHAPVFSALTYRGSVTENNHIGAFVLQV